MSDEEEESMSEGFSASEDEWKPTKDVRGGESSDDDDSDFEELPQALGAQNHGTGAATRRKGAPPKSAVVKQTAIKKRKGAGQSLRTKLYNKYRPPPKTFPSPNSAGSNSPSASTSRTASKNVKVPNESGEHGHDSSSESSVDDYLVNPDDIDFQSSFFNVKNSEVKGKSVSPPPVFDCNVGIGKLSDSGSEDNNESSAEEQGNGKSFDFANLLDNVNSLERAKETIAKRAVSAATKELQESKTPGRSGNKGNSTAMDVNTLLALGEAKQSRATVRSVKSKDDGEEEDDERDEIERGPHRLSKTKSTRVKRHTKTRPASTVVAGDTDDSDFEEVAEDTGSVSHSTSYDTSALLNTSEGLEIHVELPSKQRRNKDKKKQDLEMVLKRKLNRDLKERFLHLHKTSLLCCFARSYRYNRMLNDTPLMQAALKLLPSSNAYPPERGTEIKYFQSMVTWYKTAVKLASPNLYGEKVRKSRRRVKRELLDQIRRKEASCKQDFAFIFVVLLRAMGLQCRLIVNMQPLPLRPAQSDLLKVKMKRDASEIKAEVEKIGLEAKKLKIEEVKMEKSHGERTEKASSRREEKKREKDKEKVIIRKEEEGRKMEKKAEEILNDSKNRKKEVEKKQSQAEKKEVVSNAQKERKRAPSAKLADMIASQKQVNTATIAKKAKTDEKEIPQRSSKRMQAKEATNKEEAQKTNEAKETRTTKSTKNSLDAKVTEEANNSESAKDTAVHKNAPAKKPTLARLRTNRKATEGDTQNKLDLSADKPCLSVSQGTPVARRTRKASTEKQETNKAKTTTAKSAKPTIQVGSPVLPKIVIQSGKTVHTAKPKESENRPHTETRLNARATRSRSKSPKAHISPTFLQSTNYKNKFPEQKATLKPKSTRANSKSPTQKICISTEFLKTQNATAAEPIASGTRSGRILRSCQNSNEEKVVGVSKMPKVPQLDGADDSLDKPKRPQLKKLKKKKSNASDESDDDFQPSPPKQPKKAPNSNEKKKSSVKDKLKVDKRVLSSDEESSGGTVKHNPTAADIWVEVWCDAEEQWICIELFKGKLHSVEAIRKAASSTCAYVFAFQNDLSIKDVTARYCPNWTTTVRKSRVERAWLEAAFTPYHGQRTQRDIREDQDLRRIHEEKPMPTAIGDYKDHPLYALERHLLKFQAIYPPNPPTLGFVRGEAVYARECVHTLHSRDIWLKQARTVKLGEQPYKIVKARPKWDRLTQTVIKDQPLEIFGYWQTQDYEPPTAENGMVPRNAYGNVELFKECMLPKKTVHLRLTGLNRICKKLGIDCAQAVTGFDFHQGACHPLYDGFVVCEEFGDQVTAAWYQDQEEQEKKEQDKYEARVYGNWKKLIKGLLIRERLKKKYNF